jgi:hypothetical protein
VLYHVNGSVQNVNEGKINIVKAPAVCERNGKEIDGSFNVLCLYFVIITKKIGENFCRHSITSIYDDGGTGV